MKYITISICFLFLLNSCSSTKKIVGFYSRCVNPVYSCTQLEINSNHRFEYYSASANNVPIVISGTWKEFDKKQILLNSDSQPKNPKTKYYARVNPNLKTSIRIQIMESDKFLSNATVILNTDQQIKKTDEHGVVEFAATKVSTIQFQYLDLTETLRITNPDFNDFEIVSRDYSTTIFPKFFTNRLVTKEMGKVVFRNEQANPIFDLKKTSKTNKRNK